MSRIQDLLTDKDDLLDYELLLKQHTWLAEKDHNCVLSPDSDGLLCGLLMSHNLNWHVAGFYDGKVMVLRKELKPKDCVFLDIEVCRPTIRSVGHHMLIYNWNKNPLPADMLLKSVQPNQMRRHDAYHHFRLKYPLATVHLLLAILGYAHQIRVPESAICPLLFTDGTYKVLFSYPENVLNWLNYLGIEDNSSVLRSIFRNEKYHVHTLMSDMDKFFRERDRISLPKERGDRLRISGTDGAPFNLTVSLGVAAIDSDARERTERFLGMLSERTGWEYEPKKWSWDDFKLLRFEKGITGELNNATFKNIIDQKPLSWAITGAKQMEYTIERPDTMD